MSEPVVTLGATGTDYGNPMAIPQMRSYSIKSLLAFLFFVFCHIAFRIGLVDFISLIPFAVFLLKLIRFSLIHYGFSYTGGQVVDKLHIHLLKYLHWDGHGKLLDVGCGSGRLSIRCAKTFPAAKIVGLDNFDPHFGYGLKQCENNALKEGVSSQCEFRCDDACKIDFPSETFDAVVCNLVYHDVHSEPDKKKLLLETLRVLKKGGVFVIQDFFNVEHLFGKPEELVQMLKDLGFEEVTYNGHLEGEHFTPWYVTFHQFDQWLGVLYGKK